MECREILIRSSYDGTLQPSLFAEAEGEEKRPLLVALHTWSYDRFNQVETMLPVAEKYNLNLLLPEFRGSNLDSNPQCRLACGSDAAIQDIFDAVEAVFPNRHVDPSAVFLAGLSGGGHMTLLALKERPNFFRAAAAFVPITDLERWAEENGEYRPHILACTGGDPTEMRKRSPISYADRLANANLKIFHGKDDDVVPMEHSLRMYLAIREKDSKAKLYLDIFKGGHEINMNLFAEWLSGELGQKNTAVTG